MKKKEKVASLDSLQAMLQGQSIAIHTYDTFIPEVGDPEVKAIFQDIRSGHRRHLDLLVRRIEELGHRPRVEPNFQMWMGEVMMDVRTVFGIAPQKAIRWALQGEDMGLTAAQEVTAGDLDEVSNELVTQILVDTAEYVNQLLELVQE